jgi:hypothetical protein
LTLRIVIATAFDGWILAKLATRWTGAKILGAHIEVGAININGAGLRSSGRYFY